eukprot:SAG31_NODE_642_length_13301_cov_14.143084_18_plen_154_part_00
MIFHHDGHVGTMPDWLVSENPWCESKTVSMVTNNAMSISSSHILKCLFRRQVGLPLRHIQLGKRKSAQDFARPEHLETDSETFHRRSRTNRSSCRKHAAVCSSSVLGEFHAGAQSTLRQSHDDIFSCVSSLADECSFVIECLRHHSHDSSYAQ